MAVRRFKDIEADTTEQIIASIFYMGVLMCNDGGTKADEITLKRYYQVLESRGVVKNWEEAYKLVTY